MAQKIMIPKEGQNRGKSGLNKKMIAIICVITICIVILSTISIINLPKDEQNVAISRVEIVPESPSSGDMISIYAYLDGNLSSNLQVRCSFDAMFYSGGFETISASNPMMRLSDNTFVTEIGPYNDGTQIWCIITLPTSNGISFNESTFDIGSVEYTDALTIYDIDYSPKNLQNCDTINITANMTLHRVITEHSTTYAKHYTFMPEGGVWASGEPIDSVILNYTTRTSQYRFKIRYTDEPLPDPGAIPEYKPFPSKSLIFYRIIIEGFDNDFNYATPSYAITIP